MDSTPRISAVIPAYNAEDFLSRAIESVLAQTLPVAELIVVDDGSTDATSRVAEGFGGPVRCIRQSNQGVSAARNCGIRQARGDWIAFLDADDEWLPHKNQMQWEQLQRTQGIDWCCCSHEVIRDGRRWEYAIPPHMREPLGKRELVPYFTAALYLPIQTSGLIISKRLLTQVGLFRDPMRFGEDRDLMWRIAMQQPLLAYSPRVGHRYYCDPSASLTRTREREVMVQILCDNLRRAESMGPEVYRSFFPFARTVAHNLMIRAAGGAIRIDKDRLCEAMKAFPPDRRLRMLLRILECLPTPLSRRVANRLCWQHVWPRPPQPVYVGEGMRTRNAHGVIEETSQP